MKQQVFIGLGSNLDGPEQQVLRAAEALRACSDADFRLSPLYGSVAIGPGQQPDYVNAVAGFVSGLAPEALLDVLQAIEADQGRVRHGHWQARTLDLDLLLYGEMTICSPRLRVPHPLLAERAFVVRPLLDLAPQLCIPELGSLYELSQRLSPDAVWRLS